MIFACIFCIENINIILSNFYASHVLPVLKNQKIEEKKVPQKSVKIDFYGQKRHSSLSTHCVQQYGFIAQAKRDSPAF